MKLTTRYILFLLFMSYLTYSQTNTNIKIDKEIKHQKIEGFGASLAFYENWLLQHPYKDEIYDIIFNGLSLDILRVRNAHEYDPGMINRVVELYNEAEKSLGNPIKILSTSWGPPGYLKSNNNPKDGGTLKYTVNNGKANFDYNGFANWWDAALDEYESFGIYPDYISIQNEPDYAADWESCLMNPVESTDLNNPIAGYNKALQAVHNKISQRNVMPKFIGPETIGFTNNKVQNYVNALDTSLIYGIAHHLYGLGDQDPWDVTEFSEVGNFKPNIPHIQSEYFKGEWFDLVGLMYKSLHDENVVAYLYWDLIWNNRGLVSLENPSKENEWVNPKGYVRTKKFYIFKHFSNFIHPSWTRIDTGSATEELKTLAFINPQEETMSVILINRSETSSKKVSLSSGDFEDIISANRTTESNDFQKLENLNISEITLPKKSITSLRIKKETLGVFDYDQKSNKVLIYPNPGSDVVNVELSKDFTEYKEVSIIDAWGRTIKTYKKEEVAINENNIRVDCKELPVGMYFLKIISNDSNKSTIDAKFLVK